MENTFRAVRVGKDDTAIIQSILSDHIDNSDRRETLPPMDHLHQLLTDDRSYLIAVITGERTVAGYALAYRFPSLYAPEYLAYLYDIEVSEEHRRKGAGRQLLNALLHHLKNDGVNEVWLGTAVDNEEGQGFFSATGAIRSEESFNDYTYYLKP